MNTLIKQKGKQAMDFLSHPNSLRWICIACILIYVYWFYQLMQKHQKVNRLLNGEFPSDTKISPFGYQGEIVTALHDHILKKEEWNKKLPNLSLKHNQTFTSIAPTGKAIIAFRINDNTLEKTVKVQLLHTYNGEVEYAIQLLGSEEILFAPANDETELKTQIEKAFAIKL